MDFRLLGPLEVRDGDRAVRVRAGKERALLALLLVNAGRTLAVDRIVDELWGEDAPATAAKIVQIHVSALRKVLPPGMLRTRPPGYVLELEPDRLDLLRFERLVAEAQSALAEGRSSEAAEGFGAALALWRGPALAEFASEPFAGFETARLEEARMGALEQRIEAELQLGRHGDLVGELEALVARHPLRESLRRQHVLALYRSGRQAEALASYQDARRALDAELGLEPSQSLRELELQILRQDPALELLPPAASRAGSAPEQATTLLEREAAFATLEDAIDGARRGRGRAVVVVGEAGIGKTALVESIATRSTDGLRVLAGACDPLLTPRALGPVRDIAQKVGGPLEAALATAAQREDVLHALVAELAGGGPTLLVVEDAHWADEGTTDVLAFLARRVRELPVALVVTSRPEGAGARHGALTVLGDLARDTLTRIELESLSAGAVAELARAVDRSPDGLHEATGGNPFFVTEVLAAEGEDLPLSVRDAVLARCARLSPEARDAVELVSVVPGRVELAFADALGVPPAAIEESLAAGILVAYERTLRFRHEIARRAVERTLSPPRRLALERRVLEQLQAGEADVARLVHHARRAGVHEAVRRHAPVAARAAAAAGSHREATAHYRAALAASKDLATSERAELLEGLSVEAYLCDRVDEALDARREAIALREELGELRPLGDGLRWLSRILWWAGRGTEAAEAGDESIAVLEAFPDSRELAMALSGLSQLQMLAWSLDEAIELGARAIELARVLDDRETASHALTNVGMARMLRNEVDEGRVVLGEAHALAEAGGLHDHAARALTGLSCLLVERREPGAEEELDRAIAYAGAHELDGYRRYVLGFRATRRFDRGAWADAELDARESLSGRGPGISGFPALVTLARIQTLRGDPTAAGTLDEVSALAHRSRELQRTWAAAVAHAERSWLSNDRDRIADDVAPVFEHASGVRDIWLVGELAFWLWRAGALTEAPSYAAEPYRLSIEGDWEAAAAWWERGDFPYARAEALWHGDEEARAEALALYERLGATAAAARLRNVLAA